MAKVKSQAILKAKFSHVNSLGCGADVIGIMSNGSKVRVIMTEAEVKEFIDGLHEGYEIKEVNKRLSEETKERSKRQKESK